MRKYQSMPEKAKLLTKTIEQVTEVVNAKPFTLDKDTTMQLFKE